MATAFLFPGQGSQYVGMAKDLVESFPEAREVFAQADEILGFPLREICFNGPEEKLVQTRYTQPAIFVHSYAAFSVLKSAGVPFGAVAGHSLGEYSALVASGALDFETGLRLVAERGRLMQGAGEQNPGTMAAILGLDSEKVAEVCEKCRTDQQWVGPANFNAPGQVVISGSPEAVQRAVDLAKELGARRAVMLPVSGAFHSPLMTPAARAFTEILDGVTLKPPAVPVYSNVTARPEKNPDALMEALRRQLSSPVLWEQSVRAMLADGFDTFYEVGPGTVLLGLLRRIDRGVTGLPAGRAEELKQIVG